MVRCCPSARDDTFPDLSLRSANDIDNCRNPSNEKLNLNIVIERRVAFESVFLSFLRKR